MSVVNADNQTAVVIDWVESNVGGRVVDVRPQPRWRPQWLVDVERDGETVDLMVRGTRTDTALVWPLDHEMRFEQVLERQGMLVAKVYGWIDQLPAYVMERVPGSPNFARSTDAERDVVVDEYLQALAAIHSLDIAPFIEAGIDRAQPPEDPAMIGMRRLEAVYRKQKRHPDPFMEFSLGWFHRHPPLSRGRESAVVWDSGQFHHHQGHLQAVIDLELGHIGDPMMDLAGWRMRDSIIPFGDFTELYDRYAELTGKPVDVEAIELHHFAFTLSNQLSFSHALKDPAPGSDFATNLQWCNETNLYATEALAEYLGVELPTVEPLEPRHSKVAAAHEHLVRAFATMKTDDEYLRHQLRISFRLARHLMRFDEIGDAAIEADLDDIHRLLGKRPSGWEEGEVELERFVVADAGEGRHDEQLLELFHRRNLRAQMLNGPEGSAMTRHNPIQPFRRPSPAGAR
jgi:aminoglycoside phosphotransferase (APT) family kinase protein